MVTVWVIVVLVLEDEVVVVIVMVVVVVVVVVVVMLVVMVVVVALHSRGQCREQEGHCPPGCGDGAAGSVEVREGWW